MRSNLALSTLVVASLFGATAIASAQTQSQPAPGASSSGNVGPGATDTITRPGDTTAGSMDGRGTGGVVNQNDNMGVTSGRSMRSGPGASEQGAPAGASVNSKGDATQPGKVKDGATR